MRTLLALVTSDPSTLQEGKLLHVPFLGVGQTPGPPVPPKDPNKYPWRTPTPTPETPGTLPKGRGSRGSG